jgi:hypothetical protein
VTRSIIAPQAPQWDPIWPGQCGMLTERQLLACVRLLQVIDRATTTHGFAYTPINVEPGQTWGIDHNGYALLALQGRGYVAFYADHNRVRLTDAGKLYLAQIIAARAESFTYARCLALRTSLGSRVMTSDQDRGIHAACNCVLHGSDAERTAARERLATCAVRVAELEALSTERAA